MKKLPKRFTVTKKQTIDGQTYNVGDYALKKKRAGGGVYLNMDNGEMLGVDSDNISKLTEKFEKGGKTEMSKRIEFADKMAQYVAYQKDKTGKKSDSWYDKTEMKLKQQGFDKLYKQYKKLGGKQEIEDFEKGGKTSKFWEKTKSLGKKGWEKSKELAHEANERRKENLHLKRKQTAHNVGLETSQIIQDKEEKGEITSKKALQLDKKLLEARDIEIEHYTYPEGPKAKYEVKKIVKNLNPMDPYFAKGGKVSDEKLIKNWEKWVRDHYGDVTESVEHWDAQNTLVEQIQNDLEVDREKAEELSEKIYDKYSEGGSKFEKGGRILVGRFDENQLKNKEDKKAIEKAQKESGLTYIDSKIIKKGGKMFMEVHLIPNEEYYNSSKFAKGGETESIDKHYKIEFLDENEEIIDVERYGNTEPDQDDYYEMASKLNAFSGIVYSYDEDNEDDTLKDEGFYETDFGVFQYKKGGSIDKQIDEVEKSIDTETDMERMEELYQELEVLEQEKEQQLSRQKMMFGGTTSMPRGSGWGDYEKGDRVLKKKDLIEGNMYLSYSGQFDAKNVVYIMPLRDGKQFFTDKIFFAYIDPKSKTPKLRDEYDKVVGIDESDLRDNVMNYNFYKIKNHKYKKPSKFDHGGIITSKRDLDLVVGAMMKIAVDNDCTKNDSYWTKERKDRLSSLAVDMLNKHKHMYMKKEYGVGGVLAGALVGGYIGYKYGLIQEQRKLEDLFRTEKKLAKEYKQKYDDKKKKYEEGGSVMNPDTPKIYVADLKAYNEGKLIGEWIDLTDYSDGYEVQEKIDELMSDYSDKYHNGEETEHAIHDYENFDSSLYSEYMGEREYDIIIQTHNISEDKDIPAEVLQTIMNDFSEAEENLEDFVDDRYVGEFDNDSEIGEYYVDMVGGIEGVSNPEYYFDYEALGRDLSINDYNEYDNHYFRNYKKGGEIKEYDLSKYAKGGMISYDDYADNLGDYRELDGKRVYNEYTERYGYINDEEVRDGRRSGIGNSVWVSGSRETDRGTYWNTSDTFIIEDEEYAKGGSVYSRFNLTKSELKEKEELKKVVSKSFDWYTYKKGRAWTTSDTKKLAEKLSQNIKSLKEFPQVLNRVNIREFIDELEGYSVPKNKGINYVTESLYSYFMKGEGYEKGGVIKKGDYVRDARGELGLVNKVKKGVAYVKYPSTNPNAFEPVFLHEIKETKDMHKGRKVYTDFYDK